MKSKSLVLLLSGLCLLPSVASAHSGSAVSCELLKVTAQDPAIKKDYDDWIAQFKVTETALLAEEKIQTATLQKAYDQMKADGTLARIVKGGKLNSGLKDADRIAFAVRLENISRDGQKKLHPTLTPATAKDFTPERGVNGFFNSTGVYYGPDEVVGVHLSRTSSLVAHSMSQSLMLTSEEHGIENPNSPVFNSGFYSLGVQSYLDLGRGEIRSEHTGAWGDQNLAWYFKYKLHMSVDDACFGELSKAPGADGLTGLNSQLNKQLPDDSTGTPPATTKTTPVTAAPR